MKRLFVLFLFVTFIFCFITSDFKPNKPIPFELINNLPIIEAKLNGINAKFLVDSGAGISVLDLNAMYIYGYSIDNTKPINTITGIGGSQDLYYLKNYKFNLYFNDATPMDFKGVDLRMLREKYGILGIIGSDYLYTYDFIIDYDKKVIKKK